MNRPCQALDLPFSHFTNHEVDIHKAGPIWAPPNHAAIFFFVVCHFGAVAEQFVGIEVSYTELYSYGFKAR
jgi:hypothetical protein